MKFADTVLFKHIKELNPGIDGARLSRELNRALKNAIRMKLNHRADTILILAFNWKSTPQGQDFWQNLCNGEGFIK